MYGFLLRPKWIAFHLLVIGAVVLMISLGFWQLRRLDERKEFNAVVAERSEQAPVPLDQLLEELAASTTDGIAPADLRAGEWRQVTVGGEWLDEQVVWFNRSQGGLPGDNVLTALVGPSGTTVVVNRGFVPITEEIPAAPDGEVEILARVRLPHVRQTGELTDAADDDAVVTEVRRVDLARLTAQLPGEVAPVYLDLIGTIPAVTDADPLPVPMPELTEGSHLSYAMQWFIFAACVAVGWVLAVRRSIGVRRADQRTAGGEPDVAPAGGLSDVPVPPSGGTVRSRSVSRERDPASGTPSPR
jgi:cytochrome oxidase assembly protein ShyY1